MSKEERRLLADLVKELGVVFDSAEFMDRFRFKNLIKFCEELSLLLRDQDSLKKQE